jgi:hypothetical protein
MEAKNICEAGASPDEVQDIIQTIAQAGADLVVGRLVSLQNDGMNNYGEL